jgi:hypothetical protein
LPTSSFTVKLTNSSSCVGSGGMCYTEGTGMGRFPDRLCIIVRLSRNENGYPWFKDYKQYKVERIEYQKLNPRTGKLETWVKKKYHEDPKAGTKGYTPTLMLSREEALVHTIAHELRHFWQSNHPKKRGKVWGARGLYSERDACYWSVKKTREWRRLVSPKQIYPEVPWQESKRKAISSRLCLTTIEGDSPFY